MRMIEKRGRDDVLRSRQLSRPLIRARKAVAARRVTTLLYESCCLCPSVACKLLGPVLQVK